MRIKIALLAVAAALVCAAPAVAHDGDADGVNVYYGTGCGGRYVSPFTGSSWVDCFTGNESYGYVAGCEGTCTTVLVYREYWHWRNGVPSYVSTRFVGLR